MKRVLFSVALMMAAGCAFAQKQAVKEAKSIANGTNPDFAKAEQLISGALTNEETKNDAETWNVAGFVQKRMSEKQMENAYLRKPYDTLQVYNSALNMCNYYLKCDELAQIPNEKGKIKNKYRKSNSAAILSERGNLINGGIHFFNQEKSAEALKFFAAYVDAARAPMFAKDNLVETDTILPQIAYYASLAAMKIKDNKNVLEYAPFALKDKENGKFAMEFITNAYKEEGDTAKWVAALKEGIDKFPENRFFFGSLIDYYITNNKNDEAMQFANDMLAKKPQDPFYLYVKGYIYHNMKDFDNALDFYGKTLAIKPDHNEALSNMGLIYRLQAQEFSEKATTAMEDPQYAKDQETLRGFFEKARVVYEKLREVAPDKKDLWLQGLYSVYYNLNMGDEFKEIEQMMQ